jgi:hypothetical protein
MAATPTTNVDNTYNVDDWFDLDKYRQAAGVAYEFSKKKMETAGEQERETIGTAAEEKRRDEERDYQQAQRAYRY